VALYIPAGITGNLAFRRYGKAWLSLTAPVAICAVFSASIEMIQVYVPTRDSSCLDLVTNIAGSMIGVLLAVVLEAYRTGWRSRDSRKLPTPPDRAALALLACWLLWLWSPLFPVLGRTELAHKINIFVKTPVVDPVPFLSALVVWFVAGSLFRAGALRPARRLTAISVALIPAQFFIVDRQPLPAELAGAVTGAACFALFWPMRNTHRSAWWKVQAGAFLCVIALRGLAPFEFRPAAVSFSWIPFSGFLNMDWQTGVQVMAEKFFWYGTAIWLLAATGQRIRAATALVAAVLLCIEAAQTWLPGRTAEITDPLLAIFAGFALAAMKTGGTRVSVSRG
jgi:VanZ family protein